MCMIQVIVVWEIWFKPFKADAVPTPDFPAKECFYGLTVFCCPGNKFLKFNGFPHQKPVFEKAEISSLRYPRRP